ncbi:ROK family protein [Luedemannella helvata]|uniref:ROK family protein n=1 Tax=Luedemannella helvata TaxID=349315 RepID=A0ABN2KF67_9ACTN
MTETTSKDVAVAVDVGGTGIKCALVDMAGRVLLTRRFATGRERGPDAVVETILDSAAELSTTAYAEGRRPVAAGVVVPAIVDEAAGVARWSANLGFRDVPLKELVSRRLGLPAALGHDVRAGALAEARLGAGLGTRRMLFIAIGTGIAGGYAVDGHIDPGAHGAAGEIGHIRVRSGPDAQPCGCGARGCVEAYASAASVARAYREAAVSANGHPEITAADVAARVAAGEPLAREVWQTAVDVLADGLLTGIALYDPELIVLGGGLAEAGDTLLEPLRTGLAQRRTFHQIPPLTRAGLGDEAGCLGAALLALDLITTDGTQP